MSNRAVEIDAPSSSEKTTRPTTRGTDLGPTLTSAFPLPASGAFSDLLKIIY